MNELERLRELEKAATPAPWAVVHNKYGDWLMHDKVVLALLARIDFTVGSAENTDLIAATRNALLPLLDVVQAAVLLRRDVVTAKLSTVPRVPLEHWDEVNASLYRLDDALAALDAAEAVTA